MICYMATANLPDQQCDIKYTSVKGQHYMSAQFTLLIPLFPSVCLRPQTFQTGNLLSLSTSPVLRVIASFILTSDCRHSSHRSLNPADWGILARLIHSHSLVAIGPVFKITGNSSVQDRSPFIRTKDISQDLCSIYVYHQYSFAGGLTDSSDATLTVLDCQ